MSSGEFDGGCWDPSYTLDGLPDCQWRIVSVSLSEHACCCFCFVVIENEIGGHLAEHTECAKVIELAASSVPLSALRRVCSRRAHVIGSGQ